MSNTKKISETASAQLSDTAVQKPQYSYDEIEIAKFDLDFDVLEKWVAPNSDRIPICSFLMLYEACGLTDKIKEYVNTPGALISSGGFVALDNLACNFYTLQRMRNLIVDNWSCYGLNINKDEHVFWDERKWRKYEKHYKKKVTAVIRNSINTDFANFCPRVDDDLPDNLLVFRVYKKVSLPSNETATTPNTNEQT